MFLAILLSTPLFFFLGHAETFSIHRLEPASNEAVIATIKANEFKTGDTFTIETPQGRCTANVTHIITDYIYINAEQCQREFVKPGTPVESAKQVSVIKQQVIVPATPMTNDEIESVSTDDSFLDSEFFTNYIKNRLAVSASYLAGNSLDGRAFVSPTSSIADFKGSNTVGFGADYAITSLPYNFSISAGMNYQLPRSYGRYKFTSNNGTQDLSFSTTPRLEVFSFYANARYHLNEKLFAYFGLNRILASSTGFPGKMSGDFGFHLGARYYIQNNIFAEGSANFYNLNYKWNGRTSDFSQTELELKAGYLF